ncbi:MAG TPA: serine hydrolase [Longimicrobium sp.]|jgi:CubicO group peptidase (beta-lactamase class C family)
MTPALAAVAAALLDGLWKGALLAAAVALLLRLLRERSAGARYAAWWATLLAVALLPVLSLSRAAMEPSPAAAAAPAPAWTDAPLPASAAAPVAAAGDAAPARDAAPIVPAADPEAPRAMDAGPGFATAPVRIPGPRIAAGAVVLLGIGVLAWLVRWGAGVRGVRRLKRWAAPLPGEVEAALAPLAARAGLRRPVRFGSTHEVATPVAAGFLRPMVLVPARLLDELPRQDLAGVVLHELVHLRRRDDWAILAQRLVEALCWWHPAARWIGRRLDLEREIACDAAVARLTGDGRGYAGSLVRLARLARPAPAVLAPGAAGAPSQLATRVAALLAGDGRTSRARALALAAAAGAVLVPLASTAPVVAIAAPEAAAASADAAGRDLAELRGAAGVARGAVGARLDSVLTRYADYGFSGVVLVARGDRVLLEKGYGLADRERGIPMTAGTRFSAAGMTKLLTAAAVLRLERDGRLSAGDPASAHLGAFPGEKAGVTLHHLLVHEGGLARFGADVQRERRDDFVRAMKDAPLESRPGTAVRYSDPGYSLLGAVVERVAGEPFERYVERAFLRPAGMASTGWEPGVADGDPRVAREYAGQPDALTPVGRRPWVWGRRGSLGLVSTVGDLFRFHRALLAGAALPPSARDRMLSVHRAEGEGGEGYGWSKGISPGGRVHWRRIAGTPGMEGELLWFPAHDLTLVIYTNSRVGWRYAAWRAAEEIATGGAAPALPPAAARAAEVERYAGTYLLPDGRRLTVAARGRGLSIGAFDPALPRRSPWIGEDGRPLALPVRAVVVGGFAAVHPALGEFATLRFETDARGAVRGLHVRSPEGEAFARRSPPT